MTTTKQNEREIDTELVLLPEASIIKAVGLKTKTISTYEEAGIIKPLKRENEKKYYSLDDLEKLKLSSFLIKNKIMKFSGIIILLLALEKTNIDVSDYLKFVKQVIKNKNLKTL